MERPIAIREHLRSFEVPLQTGPALSRPPRLTILFFRYSMYFIPCRADYDSAGGLAQLLFECPHCLTRQTVSGRHLILSGGWWLTARGCLVCIDLSCDFHVTLVVGVALPCRQVH